jgi:AcrR family transcriptional regulator
LTFCAGKFNVPRRTNTRERLITTASELFRNQGYAQTGVNEIMKRARTTSGSFYHFFPTKDDLLMAVVDSMEELLDSQLFGDDTTGNSDPIDTIFSVLEAHRRYLEDNGSTLGSPLGTLAAELSESHPQVRHRIAEIFEAWIDRMERLLDRAGTALPTDLDRRALAEFLLSSVEGASLRARVSRSLEPFDESVAALRRLLIQVDRPQSTTPRLEGPPAPSQTAESTASDWRAW